MGIFQQLSSAGLVQFRSQEGSDPIAERHSFGSLVVVMVGK
jgi:hypothetical protein